MGSQTGGYELQHEGVKWEVKEEDDEKKKEKEKEERNKKGRHLVRGSKQDGIRGLRVSWG